MTAQRIGLAVLVAAATVVTIDAQRPELSAAVRNYVKVDAPVVALTQRARDRRHRRAPRATIRRSIIRDGNIAAMATVGERRGCRRARR